MSISTLLPVSGSRSFLWLPGCALLVAVALGCNGSSGVGPQGPSGTDASSSGTDTDASSSGRGTDASSSGTGADAPGTVAYTLTVTSGSGSGSNYRAGQAVAIAAAPSSNLFDKWVVNSGTPVIDDINAASTILRMPASDVTVTATYKGDGSGDGVVDATTMTGKVMAGYQGWFYAKNDGGFNKWSHWCSPRLVPAPDNVLFDMWPDLREFAESELYPTGFTYKDGRKAGLYSSYNAENVARHMKWCKDYGIDGVFVQRFMAAIHDGHTPYRDKVLLNVKAGAEAHGRVFVNMWDINSLENKDGSWQHAGLVDQIKADWMHLVDEVGITNSSRYLRHKGKPLVAIWGVSKLTVMDPQYANGLVDWFKEGAAPKYQASVMFGVANEVGSNVDWTAKSSDWQAVFKKADIISPWSVGRYKDVSAADNFYARHVRPDLAKCKEYGVDYLPVVFPGFSHCQKRADPCNSCPRDGGKFLWRQFYNVVRAGSTMVYVAMFDEVDEGTAIYKIAENQDQTPVETPSNFNDHEFIAMDADGYKLPSDWYLRLTGEGRKMLRNEIALTQTIPITP